MILFCLKMLLWSIKMCKCGGKVINCVQFSSGATRNKYQNTKPLHFQHVE